MKIRITYDFFIISNAHKVYTRVERKCLLDRLHVIRIIVQG